MEKVLYGGHCYASDGQYVKVGMTRNEMLEKYGERNIAVFDFADSDKDGVLNSHEYNRYVASAGLYPEIKEEDVDWRTEATRQAFNDANTDNDNKISLEELETYTEANVKLKLMKQDYKYANEKIPHRDKDADMLLGGLAFITGMLGPLAARCNNKALNTPINYSSVSERVVKLDKFVKNPLVQKSFNAISKFAVGFGALVMGMCAVDLWLANKEDKQRCELKNEYINKVQGFINENPRSSLAKEFLSQLRQ